MPKPFQEELSGFSYQRQEAGLGLVLTGEAATVSDDKDTVIANPATRLETPAGKIILINTAPSGNAELVFDPKSGQLKSMILKDGVTIIRKDKKSDRVEFTAKSDQAVFDYATQEVILTGQPVLYQGSNEFRGDVIRYLLKDGKIFIDKNTSGKIYYEGKE
ncbi:MAG: LptA/OstA family protein [Candidatus Omnitrophota bacterium]